MVAAALVLLFLMLASCAVLGDTLPDAFFGQTGCTLALVADQPHVAEITCYNVLEGGNALNEGAMIVDGLTVGLVILHGAGDIPDRFTFTAPAGYLVDPPELDLPEGRKAVALVFEWVGS